MIESEYRGVFDRVFQMNIARRSRTAHGQDAGAQTSADKLPLLLQGEALRTRVALNSVELSDDVFFDASRTLYRSGDADPLNAAGLRDRCERWFDIATAGLIDRAAYEAKFLEIEALSARLGWPAQLNRRYRTWTPKYLVLQTPPIHIDAMMDDFYARIAQRAGSLVLDTEPPSNEQVARTMAYADVMMDGEIHPWSDGCSRVATALVMWLAALTETAPLYAPTKPEHYATIRDLEAHAAYFQECLRRGSELVRQAAGT